MSTADPIPSARRGRFVLWAVLLLGGGAACAWGLWGWTHPIASDLVTSVRVAIRPGIVNDAAGVKSMISPGNPDLYLRVVSGDDVIKTEPREDTPIGSGLTWRLDTPISLAGVETVEVWDDDMFGDDLEDQVMPDGARIVDGQQYRVILRGPAAKVPTGAVPTAIVGGILALIGGGRLVWEQVV